MGNDHQRRSKGGWHQHHRSCGHDPCQRGADGCLAHPNFVRLIAQSHDTHPEDQQRDHQAESEAATRDSPLECKPLALTPQSLANPRGGAIQCVPSGADLHPET